MTWGDIGILIVVGIAAWLVIRRSHRRRKNGEIGCGCGCSSCPAVKECKKK